MSGANTKQEKYFLPSAPQSWFFSWDNMYFVGLGVEAALLPSATPRSHPDLKSIVKEKKKKMEKKNAEHANSPHPPVKENKGMMLSTGL